LSEAEARRRLASEGPNSLPDAAGRSWWNGILDVVREPMFALLLAASTIYLAIGELREAVVLAVSVIVMIAITMAQTRRSEHALRALRDLSSPRALVIRDGAARRISGIDVARGDLLLLAEGDRVPADARLQATNALSVDESLLTGESLPVAKSAGDSVYSGTLVVSGQARASVEATGPRTEFGRIGASLAGLESERTPLQQETGRVVRWFAAGGIALCIALSAYYVVARGEWMSGVLAGLTLAMAILPEEFPVVLTVFLALGAWRISRHGVLTRRMPAIETLGAASVLCVDKTGTLTENRMKLVDVYTGADPSRQRTLEAAALACEQDPFDPMERAILAAAGRVAEEQRASWTLERDYPFGADFLAVCHVWRSPDGTRRAAVKGAAETVMALCRLDDAAARGAQGRLEQATQQGLRLLAVAEAPLAGDPPADPHALEFRWLGFVALADPLRAEVPAAVALCREAGIRVVMITGDHPGTALAIARRAGIDERAGALSGPELARMSAEELAAAVRRVNVFARVRPEQKLALVRAYKAAGEVVAMTGDGVNDAAALKAAHIGIAMGRRGTDVAREAAALVLVEDDFGSIVDTVRLGRRIYANIANAMRYIVAVHVPTAGMSFLPLVFGWPPFLFPVHVVFLEFVIDPACSIVFEAEDPGADVMRRPPRDPHERLFGPQRLLISLALGLSGLAAVCAAYGVAAKSGLADGELRAFGFAAVVFTNLALIHATRSRDLSLARSLRRPNAALWWVTGLALAALLAAVYWPPMAAIFRFEALPAAALAWSAAAGAAGVLWYEAYKLLRPARRT